MKVNYPPISVNKVWQGRRFKTNAYKTFEQDLFRILPRQKMITGYVVVEYEFHVKHFLRVDVDNFIKPFQDVLVKMGYIEDDRKIVTIIAKKIKSDIDFIVFNIYQVKE